MLNAVHCSDRLVGDFIDNFMQSSMADNTVLVVMSDHLAMRNTVWDRLETQNRRDLLMMFTPHLTPGVIDKPGSKLDVSPTLLAVMGYDIDGWGFGRNLLKEEPTLVESHDNINDYLNRQRGALSALWSFPQIGDGLRINASTNTVTMQEQDYPVPALLRLDDNMKVANFTPARKQENDLLPYMAELSLEEKFIWIDHGTILMVYFLRLPT
jgi:phosphoglycerol transferase